MDTSSAPRRERARLAAALPAAVVAALALAGAPAQVRTALDRWKESPTGIARSADAARREVRGDTYVEVVETLRARIPVGGAYAIANGGAGDPASNWLRCDLAPRTPVLLLPQLCGDWVPDRRSAPIPEIAAVVATDGSVRLAGARGLLTTLWSGLDGPEADIPGWMDEPAEGAAVKGTSAVSGWCQEKGGPPCTAIRVWLDGRELDAARVERFPRPDVCAAVPGMGECSRAGWRVSYAPGDLAPGSHCVAAALIAEGGRHRRVGPWTFTVTP